MRLRLKCAAACLRVFYTRMARENVLYGVERGRMCHCVDTALMFSFLVEITESLLYSCLSLCAVCSRFLSLLFIFYLCCCSTRLIFYSCMPQDLHCIILVRPMLSCSALISCSRNRYLVVEGKPFCIEQRSNKCSHDVLKKSMVGS